jgi:sugar phosphate isomerase/epimerase
MSLTREDTVFCTAPLAHVPLLELLAPIRNAGFSALSVTMSHLLALEARGVGPTQVRDRIADAGLKVAEVDCIGLWLAAQGEASVGEYGALLRQLTPRGVIDCAERLGARSVSLVEMFGVQINLDAAAESFAAVCAMACDSGLLAAIEFLPAGGVPDLATAAEIVRRAGAANGGLVVDAFHLFRSGSTLAQLAAVPAENIVSVQICDGPARPQGELAREMVTARLPPGERDLDVTGLLRTLHHMGVQAPLGVEVFNAATATQPVATTARQWRAALLTSLQRVRSGSSRQQEAQR